MSLIGRSPSRNGDTRSTCCHTPRHRFEYLRLGGSRWSLRLSESFAMLPRPTLIGTLFLLITVTCILLLQPFAATLHGYSSTFFRPGPSLSTRLADEESRYAVFL